MAHNIMDKMVYSYKQPMWHALTDPVMEEMTAVQVLDEQFGGGFEIFLRPVTVQLNGENVETGDFAVVRGKTPSPSSKEEVFGYCTDRYNPLQPRQIAETFDGNVNKTVETMAFLGNGNDMFISWKMPAFEVVKGDEMELYGIVRSGFDTMKGTSLFTSTYRPVCQNTINLAENWAKNNTDGNGRGNIWKGKGVNKNLLRDLGFWMKLVVDDSERQGGLVKDFFKNLATTPIKSDEQAYSLLYKAFPPAEKLGDFYPSELRQQKEEDIESLCEKQENIRDGIFKLFAGNGTAITPDFYGMMNATSEYFCHVMPSKKPIASSIMFGNRQKQIMQMVNVLKEEVANV